MQTLLPYGEIGATTTSVSSIKLSMDNIHLRNQQVRPLSYPMSSSASNINNSSNITHQIMTAQAAIAAMKQKSSSLRQSVTNIRYASTLQGSISELPEINLISSSTNQRKNQENTSSHNQKYSFDTIVKNVKGQSCQEETDSNSYDSDRFGRLKLGCSSSTERANRARSSNSLSNDSKENCTSTIKQHNLHHTYNNRSNFVEFSLSSVGRSFIDTADEGDEIIGSSSASSTVGGHGIRQSKNNHSSIPSIIPTPDTPPPNVSPSSSSVKNQNSETFSNNENSHKRPPSPAANSIHTISPVEDQLIFKSDSFGGSWDLLELDLDFHQVNLDPSLGNIVEELVFLGDDLYGMLPSKPTEPNLLDL